jgi:hypothetical protein
MGKDECSKTGVVQMDNTYTEAQILKAAVRVLKAIDETHQPFSMDIITAEDAVYDLLSYLGISLKGSSSD